MSTLDADVLPLPAEPFGGARGSGTNDKAGSPSFFTRWANPRSIKEVRRCHILLLLLVLRYETDPSLALQTFVPPTDFAYPSNLV